MTEQTAGNVPQIRFKGYIGGWENRQFRDIVYCLSGGASIKPESYQRYGVRTVPKGAVNSTGIADLAGSKFVSKELFERNTKSHASTGDLVTSLRDLVPSAPNLGRIVKISGIPEDFLMPQGVYKITLHANINEHFVISYSNSGEFRRVISSEKNGSTQVHLRNGEFLGITIFTPPHSEQAQVGKYFRKLNNLIGLYQRKHDKLVALKKAMLQKMFPQPGTTTPEIRFKGFEGDWVEKNLGYLINLGSGRDYKHLSPGDIPVYGTGGYMLSVNEALSASMDAVGIGRKGTIDKPYILRAPFWTVDTLFYAIPKKENYLDFVYCIFQRIDWKQKDESTGVPSLSKVAINEVNVLTTNSPEQQKIGTYFRTLDELISKHATQLQKLQQIKSACLERMFV